MELIDVSDLRSRAYNYLISEKWDEAVKLFEQIFDGSEPEIANCIGYIYSQNAYEAHNSEKAILYYRIAAESGDGYAQAALGSLLLEDNDRRQALEWFRRCSAGGNAACSYAAFRLFKNLGQNEEAGSYFDISVEQGHPISVQKKAIQYMLGVYGIKKMPFGLVMYFKNISKLVAYARERG